MSYGHQTDHIQYSVKTDTRHTPQNSLTSTIFLPLWRRSSPNGALAASLLRFLDHAHKIRPGGSPLNELSACRRDTYLTTHNKHKRRTSTPSSVFEPTIPASERLHTHAFDRAATGIGPNTLTRSIY